MCFFSALLYTHAININIALAFPFLCTSTMAFCWRLCHAERDVDIYDMFLFTSDFVNSLICNFLEDNKELAKPVIPNTRQAPLEQQGKFQTSQANPESWISMSFKSWHRGFLVFPMSLSPCYYLPPAMKMKINGGKLGLTGTSRCADPQVPLGTHGPE